MMTARPHSPRKPQPRRGSRERPLPRRGRRAQVARRASRADLWAAVAAAAVGGWLARFGDVDGPEVVAKYAARVADAVVVRARSGGRTHALR